MDHDGRDYKDLENKDIATYNFRGYTVLRFHKKEKRLEIGENANHCCFIAEDYLLMAEFLTNCHEFCTQLAVDVENVEVS